MEFRKLRKQYYHLYASCVNESDVFLGDVLQSNPCMAVTVQALIIGKNMHIIGNGEGVDHMPPRAFGQ